VNCIIRASVIDQADFGATLAVRYFKHMVTAKAWAETERLAARSRLQASGETDPDFLDAIQVQTSTFDYDEA
jgi:hypothetical protein